MTLWKLKFSVCSNVCFDKLVGICFTTAPWLDCLCTFAARGKVGRTVADDTQLPPPLALIVHVQQDSHGARRGAPRRAATHSVLPLTVAAPASLRAWCTPQPPADATGHSNTLRTVINAASVEVCSHPPQGIKTNRLLNQC